MRHTKIYTQTPEAVGVKPSAIHKTKILRQGTRSPNFTWLKHDCTLTGFRVSWTVALTTNHNVCNDTQIGCQTSCVLQGSFSARLFQDTSWVTLANSVSLTTWQCLPSFFVINLIIGIIQSLTQMYTFVDYVRMVFFTEFISYCHFQYFSPQTFSSSAFICQCHRL